MNLRQRIKVILNEALGVPDDINMIVNIYTDLIIDTIKKDIDNYYLVLEGPAKNIFKKKFKKKNFYKLEKIINKCDRILCGTSIKSNLEVNAIKYGKKFNIKT